jgi:dienelactone hydrolase
MTLRGKFPRYRPLRLSAALFAVVTIAACAVTVAAMAQTVHKAGAQGAEAAPDRRQDWLVPSSDSSIMSRATLFRPPGEGPFRLAVIAHASTQNAIRRAQMKEDSYTPLAGALVRQGFAVIVPERPGHGATGGAYLEDQGGCADADYARSGRATADSIFAALGFMRAQPFVQKSGAIVVGHSAGAWGALALAARETPGLARIVAFAPGRGGRADDRADNVCAVERLVATAGNFGKGARVPVTWLVAQNDSYFSPALSKRMADAFRTAGGRVDFRVLPAFGNEGHELAEKGSSEFLASVVK